MSTDEVPALGEKMVVLGLVKSIKDRRTVGAGGLAAGITQDAGDEHFLAEIALVQGVAENSFIQILELGQSERGWKQVKPDRLPRQLVA